MTENTKSYREIVKATLIFGGVKVIQIIITIIRSKFIAVLLGPTGMGISGLLTTTINLIGTVSNFGLGTSAVKNVAEANATGNRLRVSTTIIILRRLIWITGTLGTLFVLFFSPILSRLAFGNSNYTIAFIWISVSLLFNQLSNGQMVLLQGLQKLQYLAKANLSGNIIGLLLTVPLYYFWGINGIVPAIVLVSIISLARSWYFSRKIHIEPVYVSRARTIVEGRKMLTMGFMLSLSGLISMGASYVIRIQISKTGGISDVGLYTAGFAIINTYVGLIFTAMSTDYYPRLSAVAHSNELYNKLINQQSEIAILILAPIIVIFMVFIQWLVILLYSNKFLLINEMIHWAALGMLFKAASWTIGFLFLAKGNSKLFFWSELIANIYILGLNILGYGMIGLTGLGISFLVSYILFLTQVYILGNTKYKFRFNHAFIRIFITQLSLVILSMLSFYFLKKPYTYFVGSVIIIISMLYSLKELHQRIDLYKVISKMGFSRFITKK
jgi:O-antigen/teichoic acid export membrane protein